MTSEPRRERLLVAAQPWGERWRAGRALFSLRHPVNKIWGGPFIAVWGLALAIHDLISHPPGIHARDDIILVVVCGAVIWAGIKGLDYRIVNREPVQESDDHDAR